MKALIVAGGAVPSRELLQRAVAEGYDYIIAADKGAGVLLDQGIPFQLLVGDFDSLDPESLRKIHDGKIITLQTEKDFTDTEAAYEEALKRGATDILILGGTGCRQDHFIANIALLKKALDKGVKAILADDFNRIYMIDEPSDIENHSGWILSLFPYGGDIEGLSLSNVKYPLKDHRLRGDSTLTVSNEFLEGPARIDFLEGTILIMISRDCGGE